MKAEHDAAKHMQDIHWEPRRVQKDMASSAAIQCTDGAMFPGPRSKSSVFPPIGPESSSGCSME
jgi:hypothetical protein